MSIGRQGEQLFAQLMQQKGYIVEDVSNNPDYWSDDIDFLITSPTSGITKTIEVKWDQRIHETGNLYLETFNIHSQNCLGWWKFCKADYVAYGDAANNIFYVIPFQELKDFVYWKHYKNACCGSDSEGILVPLTDISDMVQIVKG